MSAAASKPTELHCVRCHDTFNPDDPNNNSCIIEHDYESFDGCRNGTQWYTGTLQCCGADYKFHRFCSDDQATPKNCFEGKHTTNVTQVNYTKSTIDICNEKECGKELHVASKKAREEQIESKKRMEEAAKAERKEKKSTQRARMVELQSKGNSREARRLRAESLGMDMDSDELNSDVDPEGCEEFDYASDSSLVPPWEDY